MIDQKLEHFAVASCRFDQTCTKMPVNVKIKQVANKMFFRRHEVTDDAIPLY